MKIPAFAAPAQVSSWHFADISEATADFRLWVQCRHGTLWPKTAFLTLTDIRLIAD